MADSASRIINVRRDCRCAVWRLNAAGFTLGCCEDRAQFDLPLWQASRADEDMLACQEALPVEERKERRIQVLREAIRQNKGVDP